MSVVRIPNKKGEYTQISNEVLNDGRISYAALGVLVRLLSKPPKWKVRFAYLIREGLNGEIEIYHLLEELQVSGYVVKDVCKNARGHFTGTDYTVHEKPQAVKPAVVAKLTQQREARRRKKQANNRKRAGQPHMAEPEMVQPDKADPTPRKDKVDRKDRKKKTEPLPPDGGGPAPSFFPEAADDGLVGSGPSTDPDTPEETAATNYTEDPAASRPEVAAGAAPNPEDRPTGPLPDPHGPDFPRLPGGSPDWCEGVRRFDADIARLTNETWRVDLFKDARLVRKYYKVRCYGHLTGRSVRLISHFWRDAPLYGDQRPNCLFEALDNNVLPVVLGACREAVKDAITDIREDGETDDGLMHVLNRIAAAGMRIKPGTDMVDLFWGYPDHVAPLFVAAQVEGVLRLPEALRLYSQKALAEIAKWPHWLDHRKEHADYPRILGFTYETAKQEVEARARDNAQQIAELEKYLA